MPQTQEEFYFSLPYRQMDLCLYGRNHGVPAAEVAAAIGLTAEQVERVYRDIDQKRRDDRLPAREAAAGRTGARGATADVRHRGDRRRCATGLEPPAVEQLAAMVGALRHRGPDEFGVYRDARAGLATRACRSSISPPASSRSRTRTARSGSSSTARSSTTSSCARSSRALGHRFRTRSDTEVIVHAYEAWGEDAFERFNGQWAVALWDARERDARAGARPARRHARSTLRARRPALLRQRGQGDLRGVARHSTGVRSGRPRPGVHLLDDRPAAGDLPGRVGAGAGPRAHLRARDRPRARVLGAALPDRRRGRVPGHASRTRPTRCGPALEKATSLRMLRADVPVGSYLSGGLDSSLVAALGLRAKGDRFSTFSLRFEDAEYDETRYQRLMAERLGSDHHEVVVSRRDIAEVVPGRHRAHRAARSCARRRRRCSCCRSWSATRASRWC